MRGTPPPRPPIRYAGGKGRALKYILPHIPRGTMVSPFLGGGAVEIAVQARTSETMVHGFDIFEPLINYWQAQLHAPEELADYLEQIGRDLSQERYRAVKQALKEAWDNPGPWPSRVDPATMKPDGWMSVLYAAYYWFNHNLSYGPGFLGWMSKIYQDRARYDRMVARVRDFRAPGLYVGVADFPEVFHMWRFTFFYCDPPYYIGEGSRMFKGIYPQRNFPIHHKGFDHEKLRDLLHSHQGRFVLSYNDCPLIREWYKDFTIHEVGWHYSMGQGETRIGKNRKAAGAGHVKKSHELLIVKR